MQYSCHWVLWDFFQSHMFSNTLTHENENNKNKKKLIGVKDLLWRDTNVLNQQCVVYHRIIEKIKC